LCLRVIYAALVGAAIAQDGPVKKVVQLLKDMLSETEANAKKDKDTFTKMNCWCKKTKKETTDGLGEAAECITTQTAAAETASGLHSQKKTQSEHLEADITELESQIEEATSQRKKEAGEFAQNEKDLIKSIGALKSAITVLSKHNKGFLQENSVQEVSKYLSAHQDRLTPSQRTIVEEFLQQPTSAKYGNQSGEIFGILQSMLDEMSADLKEATKDEGDAQEAFGKMKENKDKIIKEKTKLNQDAREVAANAAEDAENAKDATSKCEKEQETLENVLRSANEQCQAGADNYEHRSKATADELSAINQAIEILDSEEAFAAFAKTTDAPAAMFLQTSLKKLTKAKNLEKVVTLLKRNAGDDFFKNFGLGKAVRSVAMMLQQKGLEGQEEMFNKILEAVQKQILAKKNLLAAKEAEKDQCVENINFSEKHMASLNNSIDKLNAQIEQLTAAIEALDTQITLDNQEIASLESNTKELSADRSQANADYQKEMEENRAAIALLDQAKSVLADVFGGPVFLQQDPNKAQGSPEFEKYEQHKGGNKVLVMIDTIIGDTKSEMKVAQTAENASQKAYETQIKNNNDAITALKSGVSKQEKTMADKNDKKLTAVDDLDNKSQTLVDEDTNNKNLHSECDFLVDNYKSITDAHQEEVDGLVEAKTILSNVIADLA